MPTDRTRFLPPELPAERAAACFGLISDTHMPERCAAFPPALFEVLSGVELLLHAGDVGELWVLDRLSALAPVVAVHGNDDTAEAQRELPYQQVIVAAGQRILMTHGHCPDRAQELANRRDDAWEPKLARRAAMGRRAGAGIVVFGHTHVPMVACHDGVWLVNPGALASGSYFTRQRVQSVALLFLRDDGRPFVAHVDLTRPGQRFEPEIEWNAGFAAALARFSESILAPELAAVQDRWQPLFRRAPERYHGVWFRVAHPCWSGERDCITKEDLLAELRADSSIPATARSEFEAALAGESGG